MNSLAACPRAPDETNHLRPQKILRFALQHLPLQDNPCILSNVDTNIPWPIQPENGLPHDRSDFFLSMSTGGPWDFGHASFALPVVTTKAIESLYVSFRANPTFCEQDSVPRNAGTIVIAWHKTR